MVDRKSIEARNVEDIDEKGSLSNVSIKDVEAAKPDIDDGFDPAVVHKIMRKVDWRLIPMLSALYTISLIDRANLSIARSANGNVMDKQLHLNQGNGYSIATLVFFVPYILLEIPSQLGLRKFGARWWLGSATVAWGAVMLGMGFVNDWHGLAGLRAILGAFESALYPGASFLIACWYPRRQMAVRNAMFYVGSKVLAGLGNIFSYAISLLHMRSGIEGWRWIFIVQGALTVVIGLMGYIFISDFPDRAKFLTDDERHIVQTRIERDRGDSAPDPMTKAKFVSYMLDLRIWLFGLFFGSATLGTYSMSYFLPRILETMGFSNATSQLLTAPPYVFVVIPAMTSAWIADRFKNMRGVMIAVNCLLIIMGTLLYSQIPVSNRVARYVGVFLAVGSANSNPPLIISWAQTSIRSQSKRGFTSALVVAWGGVGGILSGVSFKQSESKRQYPTGIFLTVGMQLASCIGIFGLAMWFKYQNKRADAGEVELEGHPDFRYQL